MWPLLRSPFDAVVDALEPILAGPRPLLHGAWLAVSLVVSWYVYVPIHELLHALGCMATGGTVTTLEVQTQYGGAVLARLFPWSKPNLAHPRVTDDRFVLAIRQTDADLDPGMAERLLRQHGAVEVHEDFGGETS